MKIKKKKICKSCLMSYSTEKYDCPYCGYSTDNNFSQPFHNALPLCSLVENLIIGRAIQMDRNSISYIGLDIIKNNRVLIREFFPNGYVQRQRDGYIIPYNMEYTDIIEQNKLAFMKQNKPILSKYGTIYTYHRLRKKRINDKYIMLSPENITLRTILGTRDKQEDAADLRIFNNGMYAVLCDGMGGINGGEIASTECVRMMMEIADIVKYCDENVISAVLQHQTIKADKYISSLQDMEKRRLQCGTTLLCVVVRDNCLYFASVGDSHIYLIHNNTIQLLNEEHNYFADLMEKVKNGEIEYEDAVNHPKKDALTSYIGIGNLKKLHVSTTPILLHEWDSILMCSDGLYRTLSDEEILQIITKNTSVEISADTIIKAVEERNLPKQDNTTFVLYNHSGYKHSGSKRK